MKNERFKYDEVNRRLLYDNQNDLDYFILKNCEQILIKSLNCDMTT